MEIEGGGVRGEGFYFDGKKMRQNKVGDGGGRVVKEINKSMQTLWGYGIRIIRTWR